MTIGLITKNIASIEKPEISKASLRAVFLAGVLHDVDHTGDHTIPDAHNLIQAVSYAQNFKDSFPSIENFNLVIALMLATE